MKYLKTFEAYDFDDDEDYEDKDWVEPTGSEWHNSKKEDIDACIDSIYDIGEPHPWEKNTIIIDGVSVTLKNFDGHLIFDLSVPSESRNTGKATEVIKRILNIVDKFAVYACVDPTPHTTISGEGMNKKDIVEWFKKLGFTNIVYGEMERTPEISEDKFNELLDKITNNGKGSLTKEEKDMMKRYSGDSTPVMNKEVEDEYEIEEPYKEPIESVKEPIESVKKLKLSGLKKEIPIETPPAESIEPVKKNKSKFKVDKTYTHFAVRKSDNKIVDGWDYKNIKDDSASIRQYTKGDLKDHFPESKYSDFSILTTASLKRKGVDPFNWDFWAKGI